MTNEGEQRKPKLPDWQGKVTGKTEDGALLVEFERDPGTVNVTAEDSVLLDPNEKPPPG
jgi:hypothetical protein